MDEFYGWAGKALDINLTTGKIETKSLDRDWAVKYIGGSGFGARILYDEMPPEVPALSPESVVIISQGPLGGTLTPTSGRCEIIYKSPLTGITGRGNVGGNFGPQMKWAGYDIITIRGKSDKPVYLWINNDHAELRDASHLWGKDVWETIPIMQDEVKDTVNDNNYRGNISTLLIGPAGERIVMSSAIMCGPSRAAATASAAPIWGSKNLKGIAIWGNKGINLAKPAEFIKICEAKREKLKEDPFYETKQQYGTLSWVGGAFARSPLGKMVVGGKPTEGLEEHSFDAIIERSLACTGCPIHCAHFLNVKEGKYKGTKGEGIEGYVQYLGLAWQTPSAPFLAKYNNLCNQLGSDVAATGWAIEWAMRLYKDGIITPEDTDGIEVTYGNEDAILELTQKIADREGFGEILADHPLGAAEKLGKGSDKYASHCKGIATYTVSPGISWDMSNTVAYNTATRGFDYLSSMTYIQLPGYLAEWIAPEILENLAEEKYGGAEVVLDGWAKDIRKMKMVQGSQNDALLADMVGICKFASAMLCPRGGLEMADLGELITAATGEVVTAEDLRKAVEREIATERAYNAREGIRRVDDYPFFLHWQLKHGEPNPLWDYEQMPFTLETYDALLDEFYKLQGCDVKTGIPTRARLEELGLKDIADDLEKRGVH